MTVNNSAIRSLLIYAICLPMAIFLGYLVSTPYETRSMVMVGGLLFLMALPLFMRWYHPWLIAVWNSTLMFYFLPGPPMGWMLMAVIGFGMAVGHYILNRERKFLNVPSITWSLVVLALVVLATAKATGGIGLRVMGDAAIGGKRYLYIWVAIMGYFALTSQAVQPEKRKLMMVLFVLGGATGFISDLAGILRGPFYYLWLLFPTSDNTVFQQPGLMGPEVIERFGGLANGSIAVACTLLAYYGIEKLLDVRKFWRLLLFTGAILLSTYGGFRGLLIFIVMMFALVFYFEGLMRSRLMPVMALGLLLMGSLAVAFSDRLPMTFQRSLAFLPVKLDPVAKMSAEDSTTWRLEIWKSLLPEIPHYLWLGKGLAIDKNEMASYNNFGNDQVGGEVGGELTLAGDYHNGPLSLIIQFGIWGVIAFLWFLSAALKVLWTNYKYGDPEIRRFNTYLLAYFIAKMVMFFCVFGGFYSDIMFFTGIVGFSVSLNGGVAKKPVPVERPRVVFNRFRPLPASVG